MDDVIIKQINSNIAKYLVVGLSSDSPLFAIHEIMDQMNLTSGDSVLFDQLLQVGSTKERFIRLTFTGVDFDYNSIINIPEDAIAMEIKSVISDYLRNNTLLLKYSILVSAQKEQIINGGVV